MVIKYFNRPKERGFGSTNTIIKVLATVSTEFMILVFAPSRKTKEIIEYNLKALRETVYLTHVKFYTYTQITCDNIKGIRPDIIILSDFDFIKEEEQQRILTELRYMTPDGIIMIETAKYGVTGEIYN